LNTTYDDTLDSLPMTRTRYKAVVVAGTSWLFDYMNLLSISLTLTVMIAIFHLTTGRITLVLDMEYVGMLLGNIVLGRLADTLGRRNTLMITLGLLAIGAFGSAASTDYIILGLTRFIAGLGIGSDIVLASVYISEYVGYKNRGKWVSFGAAMGTVGYILVAAFSLLLIPHYGFRPVFIIVGVAALIGIGLRVIMPESPRWLVQHGQKDKADDILKTIQSEASVKIGRKVENVSLENWPENKSSLGQSLSILLNSEYRRRTGVLWVDWFVYIFAFYAFSSWIPVFLIEFFHITITTTLLYSFLIYVAYLPGYIAGGFLADRIGRKITTVIGFIFVILFGLVFGFSAGVTARVLLGGMGVGFFLEMLGSTLNIYSAELYPTSTRGIGAGIAQAWSRFGAVLSAPFVLLLAVGGLTHVVVGIGIVIAVAIIVTAAFGIESKKQILEKLSPELTETNG